MRMKGPAPLKVVREARIFVEQTLVQYFCHALLHNQAPSSPSLSPQVLPDAHDTPLQCLEYSEERDELATCAMGNKVRVWDVRKPTNIKLKLELDHSDGDADGEDGHTRNSFKARSNMNWLTKSDMAGLPRANMPSLVEETINSATRDVPEVTQVSGGREGGVWRGWERRERWRKQRSP